MLVSKFSVPITRCTSLNHLKNVLVRCASKKSCSNDIKRSCPPREKIGGRLIRSRCKEIQAALTKCPKQCCKTDSPIPPPKCNSKVSDIYLHSLKSVEDYAKNLSKLIEDAMKPVLQEFEAGINQKRIEEAKKRQEILKSVDTQIWELINLDTNCGMKKKTEVLMINDRVSQELKYGKCEEPKDMKILKAEILKLITETNSKTNSAIELLKSCRKCNSPNALKDCVQENTKEALHILECTNEAVVMKITEMKNFKNVALQNFADTLEDITESYRKTMTEFSENLTYFIDCVKS